MIKVYRFILVAFACLMPTVATHAQQILLDHDWYLAGEKMTIAVEVADAEKASRVAYVELSDTEGLQANAVISLVNGRGQGCIFLPSSLHSGNYQLSMYTRMGREALLTLVPVVNIMQKSVADDIEWVSGDADFAPSFSKVALPAAYIKNYCQKSENEGHCVYARIRSVDASKKFDPAFVNATLAVVGKEAHVFQAQMANDSTAVFNTYGIEGRHSIVIQAEDYNGESLQVELLDPFANIRPRQLPSLTFHYNRSEVEERSMKMQLAVGDTMVVDSTVVSNELFATQPVLSYNLDEYRQFHTIREVLLEYVNFIQRKEKKGRNQLFVFSEDEGYADWEALVLLDGMPVKDIDRLIEYDARRVNYISIFDDYYTLGGNIYKGIINIISRSGKLTNFPPEKTAAYIIYDFPQR